MGATRRKRWSVWRRHRRLLVGATAMIAFFVLWEAAGQLGWMDAEFTGIPSHVIRAGWLLPTRVDLGKELWTSLLQFLVGYGGAAVFGIVMGLLLGRYRALQAMLDPMLMAFYALPRTALLPLIIGWLGLGLVSKSTVVFLGAFFPILMNTAAGIRECEPVLVKAAQTFGATSRDLFLRVMLPSAVPQVVSGLRLGLGRALIGVVVADLYTNLGGIGALMVRAQTGLNTNELMFLVLLVSVFGTVLIYAMGAVERHLGRWRQGVRQ